MIFSKKTMYFHNLRYEKGINVNYQLTYTIGFKIISFSVDDSNEKENFEREIKSFHTVRMPLEKIGSIPYMIFNAF